jgi:hypothetical protein
MDFAGIPAPVDLKVTDDSLLLSDWRREGDRPEWYIAPRSIATHASSLSVAPPRP